jgi:hypothetical protein
MATACGKTKHPKIPQRFVGVAERHKSFADGLPTDSGASHGAQRCCGVCWFYRPKLQKADNEKPQRQPIRKTLPIRKALTHCVGYESACSPLFKLPIPAERAIVIASC